MIVAKTLESAPAAYPVLLTDAILQAHLRTSAVSGEADYTLLGQLIKVATNRAEKYTRRRFITQTWKAYLDRWPAGDSIYLPFGKLQSVTHVKYTDTDGTVATWSADEWNTDIKQEPGRVVLEYAYSWPSASLHPQNPIEVQFVCGYGLAGTSIPESILHAICIAVADLYENRQDINFTNLQMNKINTVEALLSPYILWADF